MHSLTWLLLLLCAYLAVWVFAVFAQINALRHFIR
jgi:hypothetical protein